MNPARPVPSEFFAPEGIPYPELFSDVEVVWELLPRLKGLAEHLVRELGGLGGLAPGLVTRNTVLHEGRAHVEGVTFEPGDATKRGFKIYLDGELVEGAAFLFGGAYILGPDVYIGPGAVVEPGAMVKGPTVIGPHCEIRQAAYLRGGVIAGKGCVIGHATEVKNGLFLNRAKAAHFAYVGDSILGAGCNLGAGTRLANLKLGGSEVTLNLHGEQIGTGLRKFGAILGDRVETGCNSVLNPGTLMGPDSVVYPNVTVAPGRYSPGSVVSV